MTAAHWIAIAAIITPLITTWTQFWLKEHLEKKKALAAANPPTAQPNIVKVDGSAPVTVWGVLRQGWRIALIQYFANWVSVAVVMSVIFGSVPLTLNSGLLAGLCSILFILVNALPRDRNWI